MAELSDEELFEQSNIHEDETEEIGTEEENSGEPEPEETQPVEQTSNSPSKESDYEKRYNDLRSHTDRTMAELQRVRQEADELRQYQKEQEASQEREEIQTLQVEPEVEEEASFFNEYPEARTDVEALIQKAILEQKMGSPEIEERLHKIEAQRQEAEQQQAYSQYDAFMTQRVGEGYQEVIKSEGLKDWLAQESNAFYARLANDENNNGDAETHAHILNAYHSSQTTQSTPVIQKQKRSSSDPMRGTLKGGSPSSGGSKSTANMTDEELFASL